MRRIPILWLAASGLFFAASAFAAAPSYTIIKEKSALRFFAIQNNAPVEGMFKDFTGDIKFDPDHPEESKVTIEVNMGSIAMSSPDVLTYAKAPEWLSVEAFPKAVFTSRKITRMPSTNNYYADGLLTLRDKTVPVTINFTMEHFDASNAIATGFATLHRKDFGVGQGEWAKDDVVKDEVRVEFRVAAQKK